MFKEFKEFIMKGNVVDLAVGVVIGTAFGKIVTSFVSDIIMPPIGLVLGGVDFSNLVITLKEAGEKTAAVTINYGLFLKTIIDFIIIALVIFLVIKGMNKLRRKNTAKEEEVVNEVGLLTEIRDLLKKK